MIRLNPTFPPDLTDFGVLVQVMARPGGDAIGEESFDIVVCTPAWYADYSARRPPLNPSVSTEWPPRGDLFVDSYCWPRIERLIRQMFDGVEGASWHEVGTAIDRFAHWEFQNYRPFDAP